MTTTIEDCRDVAMRLIGHFEKRSGVEHKQVFGKDALTINSKVFVTLRPGEFVVKLPDEVAEPLVESGDAVSFELKPGKPMGQWYLLGDELDEERWIETAETSFAYVRNLKR